MSYQPIHDYAVIGDMHTAALVGLNGSIDWLCLPHFDSPSVFAAILDARRGGHFRIAPVDGSVSSKQLYWPDTNVLVTRFLGPQGAAELIDFMPVREQPDSEKRPCRLFRRVTAARGSIELAVHCAPAFDYARRPHRIETFDGGVAFVADGLALALTSNVAMHEVDGAAHTRFLLTEGESALFVLHEISNEDEYPACLTVEEAEDAFRHTVEYWRRWVSQCTYSGRWREIVQRSALTLKLLSFQPTGAIIAAPTCSLPEAIGGERNWDYRYTWIRDAAFTIYALVRIGFTEEAERFMRFLSGVCTEARPDGSLQVMYGIDGRTVPAEEELGHLEGYQGSRPVRIGNGAYDQLQLDIYGELLDAAYLFNKHGLPTSYDMWQSLRAAVDYVCDNWQRPDHGIWEIRGDRQHFVYSKLMCWVALDRGLRLAEKRSFPADRTRWLEVRDRIYEEIMRKGWSVERRAFVQHYGSRSLDAANLMMPLTFFVSPTDPRMIATLDAIMKSPKAGGLLANNLVYRYDSTQSIDGLHGEDGTFNICTFWLVEALTRAGRADRARLDEARLIFERMLGFANHVGLYAEETGPSGEALGNFPQAFTHLALISAAVNLDRALGARG